MRENGDVAERVNDLLSAMVHDLALVDADDMTTEMTHPMLTEWVLVANVADLESGEQGVVVIHEPNMLLSHVIGLLTLVARRD